MHGHTNVREGYAPTLPSQLFMEKLVRIHAFVPAQDAEALDFSPTVPIFLADRQYVVEHIGFRFLGADPLNDTTGSVTFAIRENGSLTEVPVSLDRYRDTNKGKAGTRNEWKDALSLDLNEVDAEQYNEMDLADEESKCLREQPTGRNILREGELLVVNFDPIMDCDGMAIEVRLTPHRS